MRAGRWFFDRMEGKRKTLLKTLKHKTKTIHLEEKTKSKSEDTQMVPRREGGGAGAGARQVPEGARGMPWLPEARKDAAGCEKPRGGANGL